MDRMDEMGDLNAVEDIFLRKALSWDNAWEKLTG
jgi:hypothetical protein